MGAVGLGATIAANFNTTEINGQIKKLSLLAANAYEIFNRKKQARITTVRPKSKILLGLDYNIEKWNFILSNTYFGEVKWDHGSDPLKDQVFAGKVIADLILGYEFSQKISATIEVNNLLNVHPDELDPKGDVVTDLGGRFKYPWEVNQFGFAGTIINAGLSFRF